MLRCLCQKLLPLLICQHNQPDTSPCSSSNTTILYTKGRGEGTIGRQLNQMAATEAVQGAGTYVAVPGALLFTSRDVFWAATSAQTCIIKSSTSCMSRDTHCLSVIFSCKMEALRRAETRGLPKSAVKRGTPMKTNCSVVSMT